MEREREREAGELGTDRERERERGMSGVMLRER